MRFPTLHPPVYATARTPCPLASLTTTLTTSEAQDLVNEDWSALARLLPARETNLITYSRKVFIPLTRLCRDSCGYCTFAHHGGLPPGASAYLTPEEVLEIAANGAAAGCTEALFTLGDRPEERWPAAREQLAELGYISTVEYVAAVSRLVLRETGLLPHTNVGLLSAREMAALREVSASQGLMLESVSPRLLEKGGAHQGCATKEPRLRLKTIERAGRLRIPFTTGVLLGIGETRAEVIEALLAIRRLHARWGHVQACREWLRTLLLPHAPSGPSVLRCRRSSCSRSAPSRAPASKRRPTILRASCCGPSAPRGAASVSNPPNSGSA